MFTKIYLITFVLAALALVFWMLRRAVKTYATYRGTRVITCPETKEPAAIEVDAPFAAFSAITDEPDLRLKRCSRWPERHDCNQDCLNQVIVSPEHCLAKNLLMDWYEDKTCLFCGKRFADIDWATHKPTFMTPEGKTVEWQDIPAETIPNVLATHLPVCWNCHIAETFRREHAELVVYRNYRNLKLR
jgi:hypothetical protein